MIETPFNETFVQNPFNQPERASCRVIIFVDFCQIGHRYFRFELVPITIAFALAPPPPLLHSAVENFLFIIALRL